MDAGGDAWLQVSLQPDAVGFEYLEFHLVELVELDRIRTQSLRGFPLPLMAIQDAPTLWNPAITPVGMPVYLHPRDLTRFLEFILNPLGLLLVGAPSPLPVCKILSLSTFPVGPSVSVTP